MKRLGVVAIVLLCGLLVVASIPYDTPGAPDWAVTVVDSSGAPVKGALVREIYRNYSAESEDHRVDQNSDAFGHARFISQVTRASRLQRWLETLSSATALAHASFGPTAYVLVFQGEKSTTATLGDGSSFWTGSPPKVESVIVLQ